MDQEPDVIREHIEETRESLTEKLESLENQVKGTVQDARATVEETIDTVKSTVQETVESVKRTFNVRYQTEQHPWPMVGASAILGFAVGSLLGGRPRHHIPERMTESGYGGAVQSGAAGNLPNGTSSSLMSPPVGAQPKQPGIMDKLMSAFEGEMDQIKGVAIGAGLGLVRDVAKQSLPPSLAPQVEEIINDLTSKLGGRPVRGPVVDPATVQSFFSRS